MLNRLNKNVGNWTLINGGGSGYLQFVMDGATAPVITATSSTTSLTISMPIQLDADTTAVNTTGTNPINLSGAVSGVGGIIKTGTNTLTLSGTTKTNT